MCGLSSFILFCFDYDVVLWSLYIQWVKVKSSSCLFLSGQGDRILIRKIIIHMGAFKFCWNTFWDHFHSSVKSLRTYLSAECKNLIWNLDYFDGDDFQCYFLSARLIIALLRTDIFSIFETRKEPWFSSIVNLETIPLKFIS